MADETLLGKASAPASSSLPRSMWITTALGALGACQFGWAVGVTNEPQQAIETDLDLPKDGLPFAMAVAAVSLAAIVGANAAGGLADALGRRLLLILTSLLFLAGGAGCVVAGLLKGSNGYIALVAARAVIGLGVGAASTASPLYLGEIAPRDLRGAFGSIPQLCITLFIVFAQVAGIWCSTSALWGWMLGAHALFGALSLLTAPLLLESPRWLVARGRVEEARKVLAAMRGYALDSEAAEVEIAELQAAATPAVNGKAAPSPSVLQVLASPLYRPPTLVACFLQLAQQLSGINAVFFFSTSFFKDAGIDNALLGTLAVREARTAGCAACCGVYGAPRRFWASQSRSCVRRCPLRPYLHPSPLSGRHRQCPRDCPGHVPHRQARPQAAPAHWLRRHGHRGRRPDGGARGQGLLQRQQQRPRRHCCRAGAALCDLLRAGNGIQ